MNRVVPVLALLLVAGAAAAAPPVYGPPAPSPAFEYTNGQWVRRADSCGTPQVPGTSAPPVFLAGQVLVYLNRNGGTYHVGAASTNSATNTASVGQTATITIPPMTASFNWSNIRACVAQHYAAYDVVFTETEPASGTYIEAVVGGTGNEIDVGVSGGTLLGVASADNFCGVTSRGIAFSFSQAHLGVPRQDEELCATIAHEVGHLLALEHETLSPDLMSYVPIADSGTKAFVNQSSNCGTLPGQSNPCTCGGSQTNSASRLTQFVGLGTPTPPHMAILDPADGAQVEAGFPVHAEGDEALTKVELRVDGILVQTIQTPPYAFNAPGDLGSGTHQVEVRGYDLQDTPGSASIEVTIGDPCQGDGDCASDQTCVGGRCVLGPGSPGGLGEACTDDADCASNLCVTSGTDMRCVESCAPGSDDCPGGFDCLGFDGGGVCWPGDGGGGGCASTGGGGELPIGLGLAFAALFARGSRRRRRSHRQPE